MLHDRSDVRFDITHEGSPSKTLVAGFSQFGLAGLTAADYLHEQLDLEVRGRVRARGLPTITPFDQGTPRHHTRLFSAADGPLTTLVGEMFVPVETAPTFADATLNWMEGNAVEEVLVLSGVPLQHGPEQHDTFYVASEDFREHRLADADVAPMGTGFLDGVNGALLERGIDTDLRVGVLVTPVHAQVPDVEAAIRLLETTASLYDFDLDMEPLEAFAADVSSYYAELQERMANSEDRSLPEDRMFM